jgi:hypothetical protein
VDLHGESRHSPQRDAGGDLHTVPFRTLALTEQGLGSYGQVRQLDGRGLARDTA